MVDILIDIHVMVNWQLSKRVSADQCYLIVSQAKVYNSLRWSVFFKVIRWPVVAFNWSQAQDHNEKAI